MPRVELKDQLDIIRSLRSAGGYARKWASGFQKGPPDLICALPEIGAFFIELKSFVLTRPTECPLVLNWDLGVQPKQNYELKLLTEGGAYAMIGVVVHYSWGAKPRWLHLTDWRANTLSDYGFSTVDWSNGRYQQIREVINERNRKGKAR